MCDSRAGAGVLRVALKRCLLIAALGAAPAARAADGWDASAGLTSDYLVRGITRSDHDPALQFDAYYTSTYGVFAGASLSNARVNTQESWDAEIGAFIGYRYAPGGRFSGRVLYSHYAYPWNHVRAEYDYDELEAQLTYEGWLQVVWSYSPNYTRYVAYPYPELLSLAEHALELAMQRPLVGRLLATGGVGYAYLSGPGSTGYVYLSAGLAYDLGHCSLALAYVNTSSGAKALFYSDATSNRVVGTVIWRF